jgi:hypothetical protein
MFGKIRLLLLAITLLVTFSCAYAETSYLWATRWETSPQGMFNYSYAGTLLYDVYFNGAFAYSISEPVDRTCGPDYPGYEKIFLTLNDPTLVVYYRWLYASIEGYYEQWPVYSICHDYDIANGYCMYAMGWSGYSGTNEGFMFKMADASGAGVQRLTSNFASVELGSDCQIMGDYLYGTCGYEPTQARGAGFVVYKIPKHFAVYDVASVYVDTSNVPGYPNSINPLYARGFALDNAMNLYVIYKDGVDGFEKVMKFDSNKNLISTNLLGTTYTNCMDIDYSNDGVTQGGELFMTCNDGIKVFNTSGTLLRTIDAGTRYAYVHVTPTPKLPINFIGTVNLLSWQGSALPIVTVKVDLETFVGVPLTAVDANTGTFTLTLENGPHNIKVKANMTLSQTQSGTTPAFNTATFNLQCGDNTGDNVIDDFDFNAVITNFGGGAGGDGNGDAATDDFDFNLVITNFGSTGS